MIKKVLLIFIFISFLNANEYSMVKILARYNIDIYSKSTNGWIRILNSKEEMEKRNIYIDKHTLIIFKKYFKNKLSDKNKKYTMEITK